MRFFDKITGKEDKIRQFEELRIICKKHNSIVKKFTKNALALFELRKDCVNTIELINEHTSDVSNLPKWCKEEINDSINLIEDFRMAVKYEASPEQFANENDKSGRTATFMATGGAIGVATAAFGPTAAMSLATVLGTASTGTAISALSGAAATNAALAWLGGGAMAAGGAGIAGGNIIIGLFGPVGVAIARASGGVGLAVIRKKNRDATKKALAEKENIQKDNKELSQRNKELQALSERSRDFAEEKLKPSCAWLLTVEPKDYKEWTKEQKHELEVLINNVSNMAQLINQRV